MKMLKKILSIIAIASVSLMVMTSCNGDKGTPVTPGDATNLNGLITEVTAVLASATTDQYPQASITTLQNALTTTKNAVASGVLSQSQLDNLYTNLDNALAVFYQSALEGIDDSAVIFAFDFDEESTTELTATGTKAYKATLKAGPSEIFGTATGKPTFVDGPRRGKAMHFTAGAHLAINDYNATDLLRNVISYSVWIKVNNIKGGNYIMSLNYWNNWKLQIQEQGKPFYTVATTVGITDMDNEVTDSFVPGTWGHLVAVQDLNAGTLRFYVNGELTKEWDAEQRPALGGTIAPEFSSVTGKKLPFLIGTATTIEEATAAWDWTWNTPELWDWFDGAMDNLAVYNIALTAGQVALLYNQQKPLE